MNVSLQPQLKNADEIKAILKQVEVTYKLDDGRDVSTLLTYLPSKQGASSHEVFFEKVKSGIFHNFVFSCTEVEKKLGLELQDSAQELFDKALRKISKQTAQGELGELILFTLLDVYFQAPKILSKVSMKSSPKMPVFGADAVHGQFCEGRFTLYLGESKLYKEFKSAATAAAKSIGNAIESYQTEFDLLDSHIDFPDMNADLESELLTLLNPFSNQSISEVIHSPCFIGFAEPQLIAGAKTEEDFIEAYSKLAEDYIQSFFEKIEKKDVAVDQTSLLMLPFTDVNQLVAEFIDHMGIEE